MTFAPVFSPSRGAASRMTTSSWAVPAALALLHLFLALLAFHPSPLTGGDDATYISLARSLIERHDYTSVWDPSLPRQTMYPPLFPALVALALLSGLGVATGLKLMMVAISSAAVFASCLWLWRVAKPAIAIGACLLVALSPEIIYLGRGVLSDPLFWLFTMLALLSLVKSERAPVWRWDLAASVCITAAYFTRSAGLPLLLAALVWYVLSGRKRGLAILLATALPWICLWWLRSGSATEYAAAFMYVDPYTPVLGKVGVAGLFSRLGQNIHEYRLHHIPQFLSDTGVGGIWLGTLLLSLAFLGWYRRISASVRVVDLWTLFYLGLVLLWPSSWSSSRFLLPLVPVLALYVSEAVAFLFAFAHLPRLAGVVAIGSLVLCMAPGIVHYVGDASQCRGEYAAGNQFPCVDPAFGDFLRTAAAVKGRLPAGSVVISRKPTLFYLYSGYQSRMYPMVRSDTALFEEAASARAEYVVIDRIPDLAPRYLYPVLLARSQDFCLLRRLSYPMALLTRLQPSPTPSRSLDGVLHLERCAVPG